MWIGDQYILWLPCDEECSVTHAEETSSGAIIDVHGHLGDILYRGGGSLIGRSGVPAPPERDFITRAEDQRYWDPLGLVPRLYPLARPLITRAERRRNASASLEHFRSSLDASGVTHAVCLPIPPHVTFADLAAAARSEPRVVPFTGVDHTVPGDVSGLAATLAADVAAGARGLKLHPVIQNVSLGDPRTRAAVESFAVHGLPVLVHTGVSSYYLGSERSREQPRFGAIADFERLVRDFPHVSFIAGHAGLMQVKKLMRRLGGLPNVWVDTSFQSVARVRELVACFGPERVLFASDWPYGYRPPALAIVREACRGDAALARRLLHDNAAELLRFASLA